MTMLDPDIDARLDAMANELSLREERIRDLGAELEATRIALAAANARIAELEERLEDLGDSDD